MGILRTVNNATSEECGIRRERRATKAGRWRGVCDFGDLGGVREGGMKLKCVGGGNEARGLGLGWVRGMAILAMMMMGMRSIWEICRYK